MKKEHDLYEDLTLDEDITLSDTPSLSVDESETLENVIIEDVSKRKEDRSTFVLGTGKKRDVIFADKIRFHDFNSGILTAINDAELYEDPEGAYLCADRGSFKAKFNRQDTNELFTVEKGDYKVTFFSKRDVKTKGKSQSAKMKSDKRGIVFENTQDNTDMEYYVFGSKVKENIIITAPNTEYRYSFIVKTEKLTYQVDETKRIIDFICPKNNDKVFSIPAPFMFDASGDTSFDVTYEVKEDKNGDMILSVIADSEWLNNEERCFPVTIDPQVIINGMSQIESYAWFNGTVTSASTATVGTLGVTDNSCNAKRMYLKVLPLNIPGNPNIEKAELILTQQSASITSESAPKIGLYKVTEDIVGGTNTPAFESVLSDYAVMQPNPTNDNSEAIRYTFDITEMLDYESDLTDGAHNFVIKMIDETSSDANSCVICNDAAHGPVIEVTYSSTYDGESTAPFSHNIGFFGTGSVDLKKGNLKFNCPLFNWKGNRMPVSINLSYNSAWGDHIYSTTNEDIGLRIADFSQMSLGKGWMMNYMQSMVSSTFIVDGEIKQGYIYTDDTTKEYYLIEGAEEKFKKIDSDGNEYCLFYDAHNSSLTYDPYERKLYRYGYTYEFDDKGRLISISEETSNSHNTISSINITYTADKITSITDGVGREFSFTYNSGNQISSITAPDASVVRFSYSNGKIVQIRKSNETSVAFAYSNERPAYVILMNYSDMVYRVAYEFANDKCISITDFNSDRTDISYDTASRITVVTSTEAADDEEAERTVVTKYSMDCDGNVISQYSYVEGVGNTQISSSSDFVNPYANSQLKSSGTSTNLLKSHSFDSVYFDEETETYELYSWDSEDGNLENTSIHPKNYQALALYGNWYLDMQTHETNATANGVHQYVSSLDAGIYTFSAYVRPITLPEGTMDNPGVYLRVTDVDGNILGESNHFARIGQGYERLYVSFTLTESTSLYVQILMDGKFETYVCAPQLEDNPCPNSYNMLSNGGFEYRNSGWIGSSRSVITDVFGMKRSIRLSGKLDSTVNIYQHVNVKTHAGTRETFTLSGWAKGHSVPFHERAGAENATFRLKARILYADDTKEDFFADFSPHTEDWQFASVTFAKSEFKEIKIFDVSCEYDYNSGYVFFDDIQLVRTNLEVGLSASDFNNEYDSYSEFDDGSDEFTVFDDSFSEKFDDFGNALTSTTFVNNEPGTIYRSFEYNEDDPDTDINDAGNNLVRETDARGFSTYHTVDPFTSRDTSVKDRCGNITEYSYDTVGNISSIVKKDSTGNILNSLSYGYTENNNISSISRNDDLSYNFAYTPFRKLESIAVNGTETPLVSYTYKNGNGRLKKMTYANGSEVRVSYNNIGQVVSEKWYDANEVLVAHYKYVRDNAGTIVKTVDIIEKTEYNYTYSDNKTTRITEYDITLDENEIITSRTLVCEQFFNYDNDGKLTAKVFTFADGNEFAYKYENDDRAGTVTSFSAAGKTVKSHSKSDSFGRKEFDELRLSCGYISRHFTYHEGTITEEHKAHDKIVSNPITSLVKNITLSDGRTISYEYDAEERITKITDSVDGVSEYVYDALGQLVYEVVRGIKTKYEYDSYGNMVAKGGCLEDGSFLPPTKIEYTYGNGTWKDLLTSYNGQSITYDEGGNPVNYLGHTLTWEKGRQLKSFDDTTYTYNVNGIRTSKTVNGITHRYILNGTKILKEIWGDNFIIPLYDNANSVCGIIYNDEAYYFLKNLQGDVIAITDKAGTTVASYRYSSWGECVILSDSTAVNIASINPFRYRSYYYDSDTGFYYLQSRYFDPVISRFINADDANYAQLTNNLFAYCFNSALNTIDSDGIFPSFINNPSFSTNKYKSFKRSLYVMSGKNTQPKMSDYLSIYDAFQNYFINDTIDFGIHFAQHVFKVKDYKSFYNAWSSLPDHIDFLILDNHATPYQLNHIININTQFEKYDKLPKKNIDVLILLGCYAGFRNCKKINVAEALAQKISGVVVASDGIVQLPTRFRESPFQAGSHEGTKWDEYIKNYSKDCVYHKRKCCGWGLYYSNGRIYDTGTRILTIPEIMGVLNAYGFYCHNINYCNY